jgi:autotransporter-associated beta strand protein
LINNGSTLRITGGDQFWFTSKTFSFDSNGGGVLDTSSGMNVVIGWPTITTGGGAQDSIIGSSGFNLNNGSATFNVSRGSDATSDLLVTTWLWNGGVVIKNGTGILSFNGGNTYSGTTTINSGTLMIGGAGTLGSSGIYNYAIPMANGASFVYASSAAQTIGGAISGNGSLTKTGSGTLTLSGANTYTGATSISNGAVIVGSSGTIVGSLNVTIAAGTQLTISNTGNVINNAAAVFLDGTMNLGSGVNETVGGLCFGTVFQAPGTWGSSSSAATHTDDTHFAAGSTGVLTVAQPQALVTAFSFAGFPTVISSTNMTCVVPLNTDVTTLAPTYTLSVGATCTKASGSTQNFTTPQTYTVISSDSLVTNVYRVTVNSLQTPVANGLALCLDASQLAGLSDGAQVDTWTDMSGLANNALRQAGTPKYVASGLNGLPVVRFNTAAKTGDNFRFTRISTIRTVFWVLKEISAATDQGFLLGDESAYHFHRGGTKNMIWAATDSSANIRNGTTRLMGTAVNGTSTPLPSDTFRLISVVTTDNVQANQVTLDRNITTRNWCGDIAEILIYNRALSSNEEASVGGYLANKYGLTTTYPLVPEAKILTFSLLGSPAVITGSNIVCTVPYSTALTNLAPAYTISFQATCVPASGATNDFTSPLAYTVVSSDSLTTNVYSVTVVKAPADSAKAMLTFGGTPGLPGIITGASIAWTVPWGTDVSNLAPAYTVSPLAAGSPASGVPNDFTAPATYTVTAEDGSSTNYTATVTVLGGLQVKTYDSTYGPTYLNPIANLMAVTPSGITTQGIDIAYANNTFVSSFPGLTANDTLSLLWEGWFDVSKNGQGAYTFGTMSDDGSVVYLDLNGDGDFSDAGELIVDNNRDQAANAATGTVTLNMDSVRIAIGFYQGSGGNEMSARFKKGSGLAYASLDPVNSISGCFSAAQPAHSLSVATLWGLGLPGLPSDIKGTNIVWLLPYGTDVTTLSPTYIMNAGSTGVPASGTMNDFTSPVAYTVISADMTVTNVYAVAVTVLPENPVIYVNTQARGTADGLSWANATSLTNALTLVNPALKLDVLWLAQGTYANPAGMIVEGGTTYSYLTDKAVTLYGGFTNGMATLTQRNWTNYPATLSGEAARGVMAVKASNVRLDGLTVVNGVAANGGGIYKPNGYTNLVVANCRLNGNRCLTAGGGAYFYGGTVTLTNCWFEENHPDENRNRIGNAIYTTLADLTMIGCTFTNNSSNYNMRDGRASCMVADSGALTVRNSLFSNNKYAQQNTGGGAAHLTGNLNAVFENCQFSGNGGDGSAQGPGAVFHMNINSGYAVMVDRCAFVANAIARPTTVGGAIYKEGNGALNVESCTFFTNAVTGAATGGALYVNGGAVTLRNSILWGNVAEGGGSEIMLASGSMTVSYSDLTGTNGTYVAGAVTFSEVMTADPLFAGGLDVHLKGIGGRWNPATGSWTNDAVDSPCIDAGDPASSYALEPSFSTNKRINMGAYGNTPYASYAKLAPKGTMIIFR